MISVDKKDNIFYIFGKAILFASMQFAIGSVEMSSKFSVRNFATDQETLDNAILALRDYIIIGFLWTLGTGMIFFINYKLKGLIINVVINLLIMLWIYLSYMSAFNDAAKKNNLKSHGIF